ncbi:MAG: hypothetical protein AAF291_14465 [Pseudomonadota bacterium]
MAFRDPATPIIHLSFDGGGTGMFAQLSGCIQAAEIAERFGKRPVMRLMSANYRESGADPEWFGAFFANKGEAQLPHDQPATVMCDGSDLPTKASYTTRQQAKDLFDRHFAVRPEFLDEIDAWASANAIGPNTLAIHYRGTDKHTEAPTQRIDDVLQRVARYVDTLEEVQNIFVASDEAAFVEQACRGVAGLDVVALDDSSRSAGDAPLHLQKLHVGNRAMGRDALLNCLMLAQCGWLCRTSSFLSAWSAIFNPEIKIAMLNEPYGHTTWLPESIILPLADRI